MLTNLLSLMNFASVSKFYIYCLLDSTFSVIVKTDGQWNVCSSSAELQQGIWGNPVRYHLPPHITTGPRSALPERKGDVKKVTLVEKAPLTFY